MLTEPWKGVLRVGNVVQPRREHHQVGYGQQVGVHVVVQVAHQHRQDAHLVPLQRGRTDEMEGDLARCGGRGRVCKCRHDEARQARHGHRVASSRRRQGSRQPAGKAVWQAGLEGRWQRQRRHAQQELHEGVRLLHGRVAQQHDAARLYARNQVFLGKEMVVAVGRAEDTRREQGVSAARAHARPALPLGEGVPAAAGITGQHAGKAALTDVARRVGGGLAFRADGLKMIRRRRHGSVQALGGKLVQKRVGVAAQLHERHGEREGARLWHRPASDIHAV
mmetsp:Transcript_33602/g.84381  ORF Transcript_33602/g.84381 Transcript_33602/m.84381 type:complete len:279 (+) Transcript_33602:419-1255(+)